MTNSNRSAALVDQPANPPNEVVLSIDDYRLITAITANYGTLSTELLAGIGLTVADCDLLWQIIRQITPFRDGVSQVRFLVGASAADPVLVEVDGGALPEIRVPLPALIAARWHDLTETVLRALGPLELRYRTGETADTFRAATQQLSFS